MTSEEMTLMLQIKANGDAALATLAKVQKAAGNLASGFAQVKSGGAAAFSILGTGANIFFKPLEIAAKATMGLVAGLAAFSAAGIKAAADDQALVAQLTALYGSAEKAKKVFKELEAISRNSPIKVETLIAAQRSLDLVGLGGKKNLSILAAAAKTGAAGMEELASAIARGQTRGLKGLGMNFDEKDGRTTISFLDAAGKKQKVLARNAEELRAKMLQAISMKFTAGMGADTFTGLLAQLKNGIGQAMAGLFEGSLPGLQRLVSYLSGALNRLIEGGKLEEWGAKIGKWFDDAATTLTAAFQSVPTFLSELSDGTAVSKLVALMGTLAQVFTTYLIAAVETSASMWKAIGEIIWAAFSDKFHDFFNIIPKSVERGYVTPADRMNQAGREARAAIGSSIATANSSATEIAARYMSSQFPKTRAEYGANRARIEKEQAGGTSVYESRQQSLYDDVDISRRNTIRTNAGTETARTNVGGQGLNITFNGPVRVAANNREQFTNSLMAGVGMPAMAGAST